MKEKSQSPLTNLLKEWFHEYDINFILEDIIIKEYDYNRSMITATVYGVVYNVYLEELLDYLGIIIESYEDKVMVLTDGKIKVKVFEDTCKYGKVIDFNTMELVASQEEAEEIKKSLAV
ncbi:hypothetical protein CLMAG_63150 [Clostridium magnum DSM 2767]|nr:hypothetical protein CLMAG_63150 [Clostridium magnum DSM 2767]SHJ46852.1 hypothetical protein SAMN02745944_06018 [Clostridium magnum DSM 2767]